jgi:ketosteroid isomerase-like protein
MSMMLRSILLVAVLLGAGCATRGPAAERDADQAAAEVRAAETAFAQSMADRDFEAFARFLDKDAVFVSNGQPTRGKDAILAQWKAYFEGPQAPFAWAPDLVQTSDGGSLGYSTGLVTGPDGKAFARFASTWRRLSSGEWRVVFDHGHPLCNCEKP